MSQAPATLYWRMSCSPTVLLCIYGCLTTLVCVVVSTIIVLCNKVSVWIGVKNSLNQEENTGDKTNIYNSSENTGENESSLLENTGWSILEVLVTIALSVAGTYWLGNRLRNLVKSWKEKNGNMKKKAEEATAALTKVSKQSNIWKEPRNSSVLS